MEKKKFVNTLLKSIFAVLLFVGAISYFVTDLIVFIDGVATGDNQVIPVVVVELIFGIIASCLIGALAVMCLRDILKKKETDIKYIFYFACIFGAILALSDFLRMAVAQTWNVGFLWGEVIAGLAIVALAIFCVRAKGNSKILLGTILSVVLMGYFFFLYVSNGAAQFTTPSNIWFSFVLAFALVAANFIYLLINAPKEEKVEEKVEEKQQEEKKEEQKEEKQEEEPKEVEQKAE